MLLQYFQKLTNPFLPNCGVCGEHAETKADFKHKMSIAQKEMNKTLYWLELLKETEYLTSEQFESINKDAVEIIKLITSIIKSVKNDA